MRKDNRINIDRYFTGQMFRRQYYPALISALVLSLGDVADALVLGNSIGFVGLAAIGLIMPVSQVFNVVMNGFGIGGSVLFSQQMARGKQEEALAAFQGVLCAAAAVGVAIALLGNLLLTPLLALLGATPAEAALFEASRVYLRILLLGTPMMFLNYVLNYYLKSDNMEKEASFAFTTGNVVDVVLNVVLVLFLRMGVAGASLATVIGQTVGMLLSVRSILRHEGALKLAPFKPDFSETFASFRVGFAVSVEFLYSMVFLLLANNLLMRSTGSMAVAVLDLVLNVSYFMINLYDAAAKSLLPLIGTYYGERNRQGMHAALALGMVHVLLTGFTLSVLLWAFPAGVCRLFGMDAQGVTQAVAALRLYGVGIPFAGVAILFGNYYEASGRERAALALVSLRGLLPIPLALGLALFRPQDFWALYPAAEILALGLFFLHRRRFARESFDGDRVFRKTLSSRSDEISEVTEEIDRFCEQWGAEPRQQYLAALALEEVCAATMDNGFRGSEDGFIQLTLIALEGEAGFELHIRDNAASFNPLAMEMSGSVPQTDEDMAAIGVTAVKRRAKDFFYRHHQGFNTVIIRV